jgi:hypothetical protein
MSSSGSVRLRYEICLEVWGNAKFSLLCIDLAEHVQEIDVNPLVCSDDIYAVDALFLIS